MIDGEIPQARPARSRHEKSAHIVRSHAIAAVHKFAPEACNVIAVARVDCTQSID